ncbi:MAG TPA: hypothetical protein PKA64_11100 [Myxococcota bacterium]|nr:hypothetical protein [Myxococcota bacterium]
MDLITFCLGVWLISDALTDRGYLALGVVAGSCVLPAGVLSAPFLALAWIGTALCLGRFARDGLVAGAKALAERSRRIPIADKSVRELAAIEADQDRQLRLLDRQIAVLGREDDWDRWKLLPATDRPTSLRSGRLGAGRTMLTRAIAAERRRLGRKAPHTCHTPRATAESLR